MKTLEQLCEELDIEPFRPFFLGGIEYLINSKGAFEYYDTNDDQWYSFRKSTEKNTYMIEHKSEIIRPLLTDTHIDYLDRSRVPHEILSEYLRMKGMDL